MTRPYLRVRPTKRDMFYDKVINFSRLGLHKSIAEWAIELKINKANLHAILNQLRKKGKFLAPLDSGGPLYAIDRSEGKRRVKQLVQRRVNVITKPHLDMQQRMITVTLQIFPNSLPLIATFARDLNNTLHDVQMQMYYATNGSANKKQLSPVQTDKITPSGQESTQTNN